MARKSRHKHLQEPEKNNLQTIPAIRTGIYARLSLYDMNHTVRDSIENQLMILTDYMDRHPELHLTEQYIDNGWSGTNFQRPSFLRMMEDAQKGKINCVVTKDLSRLGRNYVETGYYLEHIFPMLKVRYISINDEYDSAVSDPGQLAVILKNILNDFFSRDLSRRYSASYDIRKEKGVFRKILPYGYTYDKEHPNHMTFDPHVSHYVRLIFAWALEGVKNHAIAMRLRELQAPTQERIEYLRSGGKTCHEGSTLWSTASVREIITNRVYTGDFVCGKRYDRLCDPYNRRLHIPEEEWVIIPNAHPAYVSKNDFDNIQERMKKNTRTRRETIERNQKGRPVEDNYYKKLFICGICGHRIHLARSGVEDPDSCALYHCDGYVTTRNAVAHHISINKKLLDVIVLERIQHQYRLANKLANWLRSPDGKHAVANRITELKHWQNTLFSRQEQLSSHRLQMFEAHANALLDGPTYQQEIEQIRRQQMELSLQVEKADRKLSSFQAAVSPDNPWLVLFTAGSAPLKLDETVTHTLIEKMELSASCQVTIHFKEEAWFQLLHNFYETCHVQEENRQ